MSGPGAIAITVRDSALVARAREFLSNGPAQSVALIEHVCQLPGAPTRVAGRWMVVRQVVRPAAPWSPHPCPGLRELSFAVVDVETTGTRAYHGDRITEIAAVAVREGKIVEVYETLVNPERGIPSFVTALTRTAFPRHRPHRRARTRWPVLRSP